MQNKFPENKLNKETIIEKVIALFEKESTIKITMDSIASSLKMSKKTIYKYFAGKDELVQAVIWIRVNLIKSTVEKLIKEDINAVEKFHKLTTFFLNSGLKFILIFVEEMVEMGPEWWEKIEKFRTKVLVNNISKILDQGKKEGLIINRDTEVITKIYMSTIRGLINPKYLIETKKPIQTVVSTVLEVLFRGILTENGMKIYNKINQDNKNEN